MTKIKSTNIKKDSSKVGDNKEFENRNKKFKIDKSIERKLLITASPNGFLKCIK